MSRTIGLLYDPHMGTGRYPHEEDEVVLKAIDKLNEVDVDWTVIGGDMRLLSPWEDETDWGDWDGNPDDYFYRSEFEKAKALIEEHLESDYYLIRGNNERPLSVYREVFPEEEYPLWFWFEDDDARYVFLDSNPHDGYHVLTEIQNFVSSPQISMLERLMDDDPDIPTFVFVHAPLAKHTEIDDNWETKENPYFFTLNYPVVQNVLERGNTVFVNSGHYWYDHGRGSKVVNGVEYILTRHLVHLDEEGYAGDVRWMNVNTDDRTAEIKYYDVDADEEGTLTRTTW